MKVSETIGLFNGIILLIIYFLVFFLLIRQLFLKGVVHFKLLKELYPEKLKGVNTYFGMMKITNTFILDISTMFWFWTPFYFTMTPTRNLYGEALELHFKLKKMNKRMLVYLLIFLLPIIGAIAITNVKT